MGFLVASFTMTHSRGTGKKKSELAADTVLQWDLIPRNTRFARYAWGVLALNLAVVVWGAFVRASGSGAGCGSHWPLCNGEILPRAPRIETIIEFTHRLTSGLALLATVAMAAWSLRAFPRGDRVRRAAALSVALIFAEALLGAGLVLFQYVAGNASTGRAVYLSAHLVNTLLLLGAIALTAWWASGKAVARGALQWPVIAALGGTLVLGISGAVAALGDTLFPASSLASGLRQDISATAHILLRLRLVHPFLAAAAGLYVLIAVFWVTAGYPHAKRLAWAVGGLIAIQTTAGIVNLLLLAPIWMQLVHLLLADLLWIALVLFSAETRVSA